MSKRFYLDTSVVHSRLVGHVSIRNRLSSKLKNQKRITSHFVKMEFERNFVCDLIEFYFVLKDQRSVIEAKKYWAEHYQKRKIKNILSIDDVFTDIDDDDTERALFKLRSQIKTIIICFKHLIHRYENDNVGCFFSNVDLNFSICDSAEEIEKAFVAFYAYFDKKNYIDKCKIVVLFKVKYDAIKKITQYDYKSDGFEAQKEKLNSIIEGKKKLSCNSCKEIGDTIIALECPEYAILLTTDDSFMGLCKALNLQYEIIPSVRSMVRIGDVLAKLTKIVGRR